MNKAGRKRWVGHAVRTGAEMRYAYIRFARESEWARPLGRRERGMENNMKMVIR
jgi:hypothetical protein